MRFSLAFFGLLAAEVVVGIFLDIVGLFDYTTKSESYLIGVMLLALTLIASLAIWSYPADPPR
jgi:hypothetical protein